MQRWDKPILAIEQSEILEAVKDPTWQRFRISLKGLPTEVKLDRLSDWPIRDRKDQVRVDNYLNALKRGGQLDIGGNVQR